MGDAPQPSGQIHALRVAFAYDVCSPYTVGGAETHYRGLTEELASRGHSVTYITSRYWDGDALQPRNGVDLRAVTRRRGPTTGNRSIAAALRYAAGLFVHLARHGGDYDVVEVAAEETARGRDEATEPATTTAARSGGRSGRHEVRGTG